MRTKYYLLNIKDKIIDSTGYLETDKEGKKYLVDENGVYQNFVDYDWAKLVSEYELIKNYVKHS